MTFASFGLLLDIHIVAEWVRVFLATVSKGPLLVVYLAVFDIWMVVVTISILNIHMVCASEFHWICVPGAHVKVESTIFMTFLANTGFEQLIGEHGSCLVFEVL